MRRFLTAVLFILSVVPQAFAEGRRIAPRPPVAQSDSVLVLDTAWAGDRFLTVWEAREGSHRALYGVLSDANGNRVSPTAFLVAETTRPGDMALDVVGTGDSFAVFWTDVADTIGLLHAVHMTDVALDGRILGSRLVPVPTAGHVSAAWDGQQFLVSVVRENHFSDRAVATLLARDGTLIRGDIFLEPNTRESHVAVNENGFIVYTFGRYFFAHVIGNDGSFAKWNAGDPGGALVSARRDDGAVVVAYTLSDGQVRSAVWKSGMKLVETTLFVERTAHTVGLMPTATGFRLAYVLDSVLHTINLGLNGEPVSEAGEIAADVRNARTATNGNVLFVAHRAGDRTASIAVGPIASARQTLSIHPAPQSHVLVGAGGGAMIAMWNEGTADGGTRIRSARIGRDYGTEEVFEVAPAGVLRARNLAWSGTDYLAVYQTGENLVAQRIDYNGEPLGEPRVVGPASQDVRASVAWTGDRWAVAWTDSFDDDIRFANVSRAGIASPLQELDLTGNPVIDVALAFDGNRLHLAWIEGNPTYFEPPPPGVAVFTTRLRRNGRAADATPLQVPVIGPRALTIAASDEQVVLLVDQSNDTSAYVIDVDVRQFVAVRTLAEGITVSDVTWSGFDFAVALRYFRAGRWYVETLRGPDLGDAHIAETLPSAGLHVSVATSPSYDTVAGLQETDAAEGRRAVIYAEREMIGLPTP